MRLSKTTIGGWLAVGLIAAACGKDKDAGKGSATSAPPSAPQPEVTEAVAATAAPTAPVAPAAEPAKVASGELPSEDQLSDGKYRMINLVRLDGKPIAIDVWATRSFKFPPIKLAESVAFGDSTGWFRAPKNSPIKAFVAGADPDSKDDLGGLFQATEGVHLTAILHADDDGKVSAGNYWDTSADPAQADSPDAPPPGKGYVIFRAGQLRALEKEMTEVTGGWALRVGDGKGTCLHQRVEDLGFQEALLGGTQPIEVDLDPGKHKITFHKGMAKGCTDAEKVYELELEVAPDTAQLVLLFSRDSKSLEHGVFEMPVNTSKPYGTNKKLKEARDAERAAKKAAKEAGKPATP